MEPSEELIKIVKEAKNKNWIPAAIVGFLLTIILSQSFFIFKDLIKDSNARHSLNEIANEKRHSSNEKLLETLVLNQNDLTILVTEMKSDLKHNQYRLNKLEE